MKPMKKNYTFTEARQNFAGVLNAAEQTGEVRIVRKNGTVFVIRPEKRSRSLLDVPGIDVGIDSEQIVQIIREGRENRY
jgi:prevent-host-death family protein